MYQNQETQYGHHVTTTDCQHAHLHGRIHRQANYQTCKIFHKKKSFKPLTEAEDLKAKKCRKHIVSYHTLRAFMRLVSGLETSELIESRSVRGTPYSLCIVKTRRVLHWWYTLGAVACLVSPMASKYLLKDSMLAASFWKSTSSSMDSRISFTIPTYWTDQEIT